MLGGRSVLVAALGLLLLAPSPPAAGRSRPPLLAAPGPPLLPTAGAAALVNPLTGTLASAPDFGTGGGAGNTFPGAVTPFGMLAWSPDTVPGTANFAGGYSYGDHEISGFSLTHLSGAGCAGARDISLLPSTTAVTVSPAIPGSSNIRPRYLSGFRHNEEEAHPGVYEVVLRPRSTGPIDVALAAAPRAGVGRVVFPPRRPAVMLINAGASAAADTLAEVRIDPARALITGAARSGRFCYQPDRYTVYFAAQFARRFTDYGTWRGGRLFPGARASAARSPGASNYLPVPGGPAALPGNPSTTAQAGAYVRFPAGATVEVHVGISYVSTAGALANLRAETGRRSFATVARQATGAWQAALGAITVSGGRASDRRTFATALYHTMLAPTILSDVDGRYPGMDGRVHRSARGHIEYTDFSGWDIYRSEFPLLAMITPRRASDMVRSLLADAEQSGRLPRWPVAAAQTGVMTGDPADELIAEAWAFGARDFDARAALRAMVKDATRPGPAGGRGPNATYVERPGLAAYERLGYVPHELGGSSAEATFAPSVPWGSVSTTLEYAGDDFAIARFAAAAQCRTGALYRRFMDRSGNWRSLLDPATGYIEPRSIDGRFLPVAPTSAGTDYVEGDAAQYMWMVPFDVAGLSAALGGRSTVLHRLDAFLAELNGGPASQGAFLGNEPTLETPWLYDWLGDPAGTQGALRRALRTLYSATPGGLPGNDDLGELSSWYVLGALGLYPEIPGVPLLALGSPLFPHVALRIGGRWTSISAPHAGARAYVAALRVDGRPWSRPWIAFTALAGARLSAHMSAPPTAWGSAPDVSPPSFPPQAPPPACAG